MNTLFVLFDWQPCHFVPVIAPWSGPGLSRPGDVPIASVAMAEPETGAPAAVAPADAKEDAGVPDDELLGRLVAAVQGGAAAPRHTTVVAETHLTTPATPAAADKKAGEGGGYINMDAGGTPQQLLKGFNPLLVLTEGLGLLLVALVAVWCGQKGFGWRANPGLEFNWHPLLMVIAMVFLNGNAILTFRVLRNNRKVLLKYIHGGIQCLTLPLIIIGLVAVFDSHNFNTPPTPNLYSLHSWIGLGAVILFFSQYVVGLTAFLFPGLSAEYRSIILPYHVFNGVAIFALSIGASLIGLNEKAFFALPNYGQLPGEAVLINMIGVVMVLFALLVGLLVTKAEFKRTPLPEDGSPLLASTRQ